MNSFFRFKQFTIQQDRCAMKVCTDACIAGAWVAEKLASHEIAADNILDIGSGTGLLSLMLAQKTDAEIDAVEIDEEAWLQSKENISSSPWQDNISVHHIAAEKFASAKKYDLIISNPPFYENDLASPDKNRNIAMHAALLSFENLASVIKNNLAENGTAAVLLPYHRVENLEKELHKKQLSVYEKLNIAHSSKHRFFRSVLLIAAAVTEPVAQTLFIKDETNNYSDEFKKMLDDYYLNLM